jgi:phospholipid transport system substrate-binding protein
MKYVMGFALVAVMAPAQASADELSDAKGMISGLTNQAITSLQKDSVAEQKQRFTSLLGTHFDTAKIGQFALGRYNRQLTPEQRTEYNSLFKKMIVNVYTQRFQEYSGQTVSVTGARKDAKSGDILVNSLINQPSGGQPVPVDWRIRGGKVIDVIVTGVSMSVTQRDDFASVIAKGNGKVDSLLAYLRQRA